MSEMLTLGIAVLVVTQLAALYFLFDEYRARKEERWFYEQGLHLLNEDSDPRQNGLANEGNERDGL